MLIFKRCLMLLPALYCAACTSAVSDGHSVQVFKHDGSRQCEGKGLSVADMQKELDGVKVLSAGKMVRQDVMFAAVCGGGTGRVNVYTIPASSLSAAEARGFRVLEAGKWVSADD